MNRSRLPLAISAALVALAGCSDEGGFVPEEHFGQNESWIINGEVDTVHDAVVALFSNQSGCTGTIIHSKPPDAWVLTAAHCFGFGPIQWAVIGDNYNSPEAVLSVAQYLVHPSYSDQELTYDFAILRVTGANSATPVIPAMTPSEDNLNVGTQIEHVGYGLTSYPNGSTTVRHHATGSIAQIAQIQIGYNQPVAGPCSGDSGGPNLADAGGERVAGVVSYGDQQCAQFGVSGRVSAIYDSFIVPFIGEDPSASSSSSTSSSGTGGSTSSSSGVGGGGAGTVGGGTPGNGNWVAGGAKDDSIDGYIQTGSCSVGPALGEPSRWAWLALGLLALAGTRRRARRR